MSLQDPYLFCPELEKFREHCPTAPKQITFVGANRNYAPVSYQTEKEKIRLEIESVNAPVEFPWWIGTGNRRSSSLSAALFPLPKPIALLALGVG